MDKLQQLDQEVQLKEASYLKDYKNKDISIDTCNMLIENLKKYHDTKKERILNSKD